MKIIQPYIDAILKNWQESSPIARVGLVMLTTLCLVAIVGVGYWSVQPNYVVLLSEQDTSKVNSVITATTPRMDPKSTPIESPKEQ